MAAPRLALIGGLGPAATTFYYNHLVKMHAERGRAPQLILAHADKHIVLRAISRRELPRLANYLAKLGNDLARAGAEFLAIAAITPHACAPQLADLLRIPLLDATDSISDVVKKGKLKRVAIFGTKSTMESDLFGRLRDVAIVRPTRAEAERIRSAYLRIECERVGVGDIEELGRIAHRLCAEEGAQAVILAGSAFSLVSSELRDDVLFLDSGRLHIDSILSTLLVA